MNPRATGQSLALFGLDDDREAASSAAQPQTTTGLMPARAVLITSNSPDMTDPQRRPLLFLVVDCPFCDHQHIHPGGRLGEARFGQRRARCVGRPGGTYFPEVQQ